MVRILLLLIPAILWLASCTGTADSDSEPHIVLAADREAPLGWVKFYAYADSTFEYSRDSREKYHGNYRLRGDTLFLTCDDSNIGIDTAIIQKQVLKFLGKKSPRFAGITINQIN